MNKYTIIGGGPAGLAVAHYMKKKELKFQLFEAADRVGGNCITVKEGDFYFDSGAHRLHDKDYDTTQIFKKLLKNELKEINVPSQIFIDNKYVDFPISPLNLIKFLGLKSFILEGLKIIFKQITRNKKVNNFRDHVLSNYGKKIANLFLINYSEKLWGLKADQLSIEISGKRLKGLNIKTFLLESIFSKKIKTKHLDGSFLYPNYGIGTLFEKLEEQLDVNNIHLCSKVEKIYHNKNSITSIIINNENYNISNLISTIPLDKFILSLYPSPPKHIIEIINSIKFRHVILIVIFLDKKSVNRNGSMYFPSNDFPFTRIYEPRNRSELMSPINKTSIVVEIPCFFSDKYWTMNEAQLIDEVKSKLIKINLFTASEIMCSKLYRIKNAYPVLEYRFDEKINKLRNYLSKFNNLKISGRNGLFSYTHIHDQFINARHIVNTL
tara:strand:- start:1306 stop:2619 length:1314 start_codon:yes stop_codon:yes gene_type:complete